MLERGNDDLRLDRGSARIKSVELKHSGPSSVLLHGTAVHVCLRPSEPFRRSLVMYQ
jgi:hypothetical protein